MRQEVEFRFYEGRSEGPQRPERNGPALLQGGGEALMFGDSRGPGPMNETVTGRIVVVFLAELRR